MTKEAMYRSLVRRSVLEKAASDTAPVERKKKSHGKANRIGEVLGSFTAPVGGAAIGSLLGGGIGSLLPGKSRGGNALVGATLGGVGGAYSAALAPLVASLMAAIRRKRTAKEQQAVDDSAGRAVAKYLVPGLATYDLYKRIGSTANYDNVDTDKLVQRN